MTEQMLAEATQDRPAPSAEEAGPQGSPTEPAAAAEPVAHLRPVLPLAVFTSCALHAAAAAAVLISTAALPEYGVLEVESDALSLEMTQTIVLESTMSEPVDMGAAAAAMPQGSVAAVDADPDPLPEMRDVPIEKDAAPPAIKSAEIAPASEEPLEVLTGSAESAEMAPAKAPDPKREAETKRQQRKKQPEEIQRQRSQRQTAGGPTSRSNASTGAASGRASASRGSVLSYAARVRAKVASNKPSGRGHRGTARVSFGVSSSGGLSYATLARSSGNAALDQAALSAVRRAAPFGAPPPGTSSAQLRFSIPFYFR